MPRAHPLRRQHSPRQWHHLIEQKIWVDQWPSSFSTCNQFLAITWKDIECSQLDYLVIFPTGRSDFLCACYIVFSYAFNNNCHSIQSGVCGVIRRVFDDKVCPTMWVRVLTGNWKPETYLLRWPLDIPQVVPPASPLPQIDLPHESYLVDRRPFNWEEYRWEYGVIKIGRQGKAVVYVMRAKFESHKWAESCVWPISFLIT